MPRMMRGGKQIQKLIAGDLSVANDVTVGGSVTISDSITTPVISSSSDSNFQVTAEMDGATIYFKNSTISNIYLPEMSTISYGFQVKLVIPTPDSTVVRSFSGESNNIIYLLLNATTNTVTKAGVISPSSQSPTMNGGDEANSAAFLNVVFVNHDVGGGDYFFLHGTIVVT